MSSINHYWLRCDECGAYFRPDPPVGKVEVARELAREVGWRFKQVPTACGSFRGCDTCPSCGSEATGAESGATVTVLVEDAHYAAMMLRYLLRYKELVDVEKAERVLRALEGDVHG